jgi:hypothetical protein
MDVNWDESIDTVKAGLEAILSAAHSKLDIMQPDHKMWQFYITFFFDAAAR